MDWRRAPLLGLTLAAAAASAQEVRVNQYAQMYEEASRAAAGPSSIRMVWDTQGEFCPSGFDVVMRSLALDGAFLTADASVSTCNLNFGEPLDVAVLPSGSFLVVAKAGDADGSGVWGRAYDATGSPYGAEFLVNEVETGWQNYAKVAALAGGRYVVVWYDDSRGPFARLVLEDGSTPYPEVSVAESPSPWDGYPVAAGTASGGVIVAWEDMGAVAGQSKINARLFDRDLVALTGDILLAVSPPVGSVQEAEVASGVVGSVVAWTLFDGTQLDVKMRLLDISGLPGPELLVNPKFRG